MSRRTLVAFHAHPDDEALLTAGTMAKAAAQGHRVVLVLATDGGLGLASRDFHGGDGLAAVRHREALASARALGVARTEWLGYADSGLGDELYADPAGAVRFVRAPVAEAAQRLAAILADEDADVLLSYDANGGYGHRDHVRVHEVGAAAARLAGTPRVLEATIPRDLLLTGIRLSAKVYRYPPEFDIASFERAFAARAELTHRINVIRYAAAKRAAMRAHASQASADGGDRTLAAFLRIPRPAYDLVFGREWFRDPAHPPGAAVARDVFAGLA
ncbi:MAG: PIG-L family deacetylase [Tetrasphaera sp.]